MGCATDSAVHRNCMARAGTEPLEWAWKTVDSSTRVAPFPLSSFSPDQLSRFQGQVFLVSYLGRQTSVRAVRGIRRPGFCVVCFVTTLHLPRRVRMSSHSFLQEQRDLDTGSQNNHERFWEAGLDFLSRLHTEPGSTAFPGICAPLLR